MLFEHLQQTTSIDRPFAPADIADKQCIRWFLGKQGRRDESRFAACSCLGRKGEKETSKERKGTSSGRVNVPNGVNPLIAWAIDLTSLSFSCGFLLRHTKEALLLSS